MGPDRAGVAEKGAAIAQQMVDRLGKRLVRTFVSREEPWGVVWRGDMAPSTDDPGGVFRAWAGADADGCLQFFIQPLTILDPAASVAPLPED